jgi:hypothetical protein
VTENELNKYGRYRMTYYRLALQEHQTSPWTWSIIQTSLDDLLQHLARIRHVISLECIHVFTAPSKEDLDTLLSRETNSLPSGSVTAAQFLHDYMDTHEGVQSASAHGTAENSLWKPTFATPSTSPSLRENSTSPGIPSGFGMSLLEKKRLEMELGSGGDHDTPYLRALPISTPQLLAWARLLARVQAGELPA